MSSLADGTSTEQIIWTCSPGNTGIAAKERNRTRGQSLDDSMERMSPLLLLSPSTSGTDTVAGRSGPIASGLGRKGAVFCDDGVKVHQRQ